jgi:uncharacterized membrane protein
MGPARRRDRPDRRSRFTGRAFPGHAPRGESAEEILKRRYANGEISKEEYEQKLNDLR